MSSASISSTDVRSERLRLKPDARAEGSVDGAWWPRSRDLAAELPELVAALQARMGAVERVSYGLEAWPVAPRRIKIGDRVVRLGGFRSLPRAVVTVIANRRRLDLLVVPPQTGAEEAERILAAAGREGNVDDVDTLLPPAVR